MRIEETVTSTLLPAWRLDVQGPECDGAICHYKARPMFTWRAYSVERFYTQPLVWNVSCEAAGATLALTCIEVYNENVYDLLGAEPKKGVRSRPIRLKARARERAPRDATRPTLI